MHHVTRGGLYVRVCDTTWRNCGDTNPSKQYGGRWNKPGAFGVLYLCANRTVAAANARWIYERDGRFTLFDRRPERRPFLQEFTIKEDQFVNIVTKVGILALHLPESYPLGSTYAKCRAIGQKAYEVGERGIACLSAAEATRSRVVGEELALFDTTLDLVTPGKRYPFRSWYPLPHLR